MNSLLRALIIIGALSLSITSVYAQSVREYNEQGITYLNQGNFNAAITEFTKAIEADHTNAAGYVNRALAYAKQGKIIDAISDSTQAIEINPKDFKAYTNRGLFFC